MDGVASLHVFLILSTRVKIKGKVYSVLRAPGILTGDEYHNTG